MSDRRQSVTPGRTERAPNERAPAHGAEPQESPRERHGDTLGGLVPRDESVLTNRAE